MLKPYPHAALHKDRGPVSPPSLPSPLAATPVLPPTHATDQAPPPPASPPPSCSQALDARQGSHSTVGARDDALAGGSGCGAADMAPAVRSDTLVGAAHTLTGAHAWAVGGSTGPVNVFLPSDRVLGKVSCCVCVCVCVCTRALASACVWLRAGCVPCA